MALSQDHMVFIVFFHLHKENKVPFGGLWSNNKSIFLFRKS